MYKNQSIARWDGAHLKSQLPGREAEGWQAQGQAGQLSKTLLQNKKYKKHQKVSLVI